LPFCHLELRAARRKSASYPKQINSLGDHLRARRLDLKLLQKQVADQIGIHEMTIINWESNATVPEVRYIPAIIQFLGYDPLPATISANSIAERLATARRALGFASFAQPDILLSPLVVVVSSLPESSDEFLEPIGKLRPEEPEGREKRTKGHQCLP